ncbi:MAG TPA: hypothetical protein VK196_20610 [Magnetospirillum sp.]|nr:hypothetical protein [Magnetospirillum sp.]
MKRLIIPAAMCLAMALSACGHRSSYEVAVTDPNAPTRYPSNHPAAVEVFEGDVTDRPYVTLGDVTVTVSKNTIFDSDPNHGEANAKLRAAAGNMGADAVVLVRYGAVGISFWSWGTMEVKGRAIRYVR